MIGANLNKAHARCVLWKTNSRCFYLSLQGASKKSPAEGGVAIASAISYEYRPVGHPLTRSKTQEPQRSPRTYRRINNSPKPSVEIAIQDHTPELDLNSACEKIVGPICFRNRVEPLATGAVTEFNELPVLFKITVN